VPYPQGLSKAVADLLSGTNHYQFITALRCSINRKRPVYARSRLLRPIAFLLCQTLPTVGEAGFPKLVIQDWFGIVVKSGVHREIQSRINTAVNRALDKPSVRDALSKIASDPVGGSAEEFRQFLAVEIARWNKVVRNPA